MALSRDDSTTGEHPDQSGVSVGVKQHYEPIYRDVEELANMGGLSEEDEERRTVWSMLSFALEDWR
jgi:hypothetical protein